MIAGGLMCGGVLLQAAFGTYGIWRDRQQERARSDADVETFRQEVRSAVLAAQAEMALGIGWEGLRGLRVESIVEEADRVKSFYLSSIDGKPLPLYLPGQYLTIHAPVNSTEDPIKRCYSLSDKPKGDRYRITVKRDGGPTDTEPNRPFGVVSTWLHTQVQEGMVLACEAPRGSFFYDPSTDKPTVLIGAGVGATPVMSMLSAAGNQGHHQSLYAFFTYRNRTGHLFREEIEQVAEENSAYTIVIAYTKPSEEDRLGQDYHYVGRVNVDALRRILPSNNFNFYLCGPGKMMQELVPELLDWGVPVEAIHYEAFGPATVALPGADEAAKRALGSLIEFSGSGESISWDGQYENLLQLAEAMKVPVASGCRAGNCGSCRMKVVKGSTSTLKKPGIKLEEGECLACISRPDGSVKLET